jgi:hypothetical protein
MRVLDVMLRTAIALSHSDEKRAHCITWYQTNQPQHFEALDSRINKRHSLRTLEKVKAKVSRVAWPLWCISFRRKLLLAIVGVSSIIRKLLASFYDARVLP